MAIGQLTHKTVEKYLDGKATKTALRQAVRDHADKLEFFNLSTIGGTYLTIREVIAIGDHSLEVRDGGRLIGCIYWQGSGTNLQYVVS